VIKTISETFCYTYYTIKCDKWKQHKVIKVFNINIYFTEMFVCYFFMYEDKIENI